jgi:hypothetical protein
MANEIQTEYDVDILLTKLLKSLHAFEEHLVECIVLPQSYLFSRVTNQDGEQRSVLYNAMRDVCTDLDIGCTYYAVSSPSWKEPLESGIALLRSTGSLLRNSDPRARTTPHNIAIRSDLEGLCTEMRKKILEAKAKVLRQWQNR